MTELLVVVVVDVAGALEIVTVTVEVGSVVIGLNVELLPKGAPVLVAVENVVAGVLGRHCCDRTE